VPDIAATIPQHQHEILHRRAGRAIANVCEFGMSSAWPRLVGEHMDLDVVRMSRSVMSA
jgi:hypothetical protein